MVWRMSIALLMAQLVCQPAISEEKSKKKKGKVLNVTLVIRGVHCKKDARVFQQALRKRKGIKFSKKVQIEPGKKPKYFSQPLPVGIQDLEKSDIGPLAAFISQLKTPHRKEFPPKLNLILFTEDDIDEPSVMNLRRVLRSVNGLEVDLPGSLGGFPRKRYYWVQLENAGGASIKEVQAALAKAKLKLTLTRKSP